MIIWLDVKSSKREKRGVCVCARECVRACVLVIFLITVGDYLRAEGLLSFEGAAHCGVYYNVHGWDSSHLCGQGSKKKWMLVFSSPTFSFSPSYSIQIASPLPPTFKISLSLQLFIPLWSVLTDTSGSVPHSPRCFFIQSSWWWGSIYVCLSICQFVISFSDFIVLEQF